jgi:hypothetical protein
MANAHSYFFAFAEMEYNSSNRKYEVAIEASAHDVEDVLNAVGIPIKELEDHYHDSIMIQKLEQFILNGFDIQSSNQKVLFQLEAFDVQSSGMVVFYLSSTPMEWLAEFTVRFDWLMDQLPEQQNKLTIKYQHQLTTVAFLPSKRNNLIRF